MKAKDFRALSHRILLQANSNVSCIDFLREITKILFEFSRCNSVELHIKQEEECYHFKQYGCSSQPQGVEIIHFKDKTPACFLMDAPNRRPLENIQQIVAEQSAALASTGFSRYGSIWTGNIHDSLLQSIDFIPVEMKEERNGIHPSKENGDLSLAIIPLISRDRSIGLIQMKSRKANFFTEEDIFFYENIAQKIVLAFENRSIQSRLCERVKELTCLYNLALLNERPNTSFEEILQSIADMLPSAWQYPDIAASRILFDNRSFQSANFQPGNSMQSAEIFVHGVRRGRIEVVYLENRPVLYEGPFLKEERNLLNVMAQQISLLIQRRQADEEKTLLQDQLRHADRLATIGQLSAGIAHELNEPLGAILGFAQLAKKQSNLSASIDRDLDKIVKTTLHAREIVKKLMYFARQTPPRKVKVNLNSVVEETLSLLESRCTHNNIEVIRRLSPDLPEIDGDPSQLQQVLINLAVNAIQAMPEGGNLILTTKILDGELRLSVRDTGIGMCEEVIRQLFIPFFTTKDVKEGTGLGLPVVHGIVTSHGGTIHLESVPQQGSCFEIRFPWIQKPEKEWEADACAIE